MDAITTHSLLFCAAAAAGLVDAIAGGGGLIALPALLATGLPPTLALGTNKMQSSCGTALAVWRYARAGWVKWSEVRLAVACTFVAAVLGTLAVNAVDKSLLGKCVPWLLLAVAVYTVLSPKLGAVEQHQRISPTMFAMVPCVLIGFYDGFFGPGAGSFWTISFVTLLGLDLRHATARTKAVNLTSNVASFITFLAAGQVAFGYAAVMIAGNLLGARLGSGLVIRHGAGLIRVVFLIVVFAITLKLLWSQFAPA